MRSLSHRVNSFIPLLSSKNPKKMFMALLRLILCRMKGTSCQEQWSSRAVGEAYGEDCGEHVKDGEIGAQAGGRKDILRMKIEDTN